MKNLILTIAFFGYAWQLSSQDFVDADSYPFNNSFANVEDVNYVMPTSDGGYLLVGSIEFDGDSKDWDGRVVKVDANGTELWEDWFGGSGLDYFYGAIELDNGYYVCGARTESGIGLQPVIALYRTDGEFVGSKVLGTPGFQGEGLSIVRTYNGGMLLAGYLKNNTTGIDEGFLLPLTDGVVPIDNTQFRLTSFSKIGKVVQSADGEYLAFGTRFLSDEACNTPQVNDEANYSKRVPVAYDGGDALVAKFTITADQQWTTWRTWEESIGGDTGDFFIDGVATSDGGYAILGKTICVSEVIGEDSGPDNITEIDGLFYPHWLYKG
ncbi:MAG: hypothetical protein AAF242_10035, partial [Bacteroidota bacterium]